MSQPAGLVCLGLHPPARSKLILPDLGPIASRTGLVVRKSGKFTPEGFLQTLLGSVVTGLGSLNQLVGSLKDFVAAPMARQSFHERFSTRSTAFLMNVLTDLTEQRYRPAADALGSGPVRRILIEDASGQVMPKGNSAAFSAHGNRHGDTAGVKIDLAFDLLAGNVVSYSLHAATEQYKTVGRELVAGVGPGDLVLRTWGISRWPSSPPSRSAAAPG